MYQEQARKRSEAQHQSQKAREQWPKAVYYTDYRPMLEKEKDSIDAVIVSTPDHMHAPIAMAAMQLGKHVYVEKPLTHNISEARQLTEAAKQYKLVTQKGSVLSRKLSTVVGSSPQVSSPGCYARRGFLVV